MNTAQQAKPHMVTVKSLKSIGGSDCDAFNNTLANATLQTLWLKNSDAADREKQIDGTIGALIGMKPVDEIEGMIAAQLLASHMRRWNATEGR